MPAGCRPNGTAGCTAVVRRACPKATCPRRGSGKPTTPPTPPARPLPIARKARSSAAASAPRATGDYEAWTPGRLRPCAGRYLAPAAACCSLALGACGETRPTPERGRTTEVPKDIAPAAPAPRPVESRHGTPMAERVATIGLLNKRNNLTQRPGDEAGRIAPGRQRDRPARGLRAHRAVGRAARDRRVRPGLRPGTARDGQRAASGTRCSRAGCSRTRPALNVVEHPIYDVWVKDCAMNFPGEEAPRPRPRPAARRRHRASARRAGARRLRPRRRAPPRYARRDRVASSAR